MNQSSLMSRCAWWWCSSGEPSDADASSTFVGSVSAAVGKTLVDNSVFTQETCANYQTTKIESHFKISATASASYNCADGGSVELAPVPGSQIYALVDKACTDNAAAACDATCPAESTDTTCPCESALGYFICEESNAAEGPGRFETKPGLVVCGQTPSGKFFLTDYISPYVISTGEETLRDTLLECGAVPPQVNSTTTTPGITTPGGAGTTTDGGGDDVSVSGGLQTATSSILLTIASLLVAIVV